jgi:hypothetical protein
MMEIKKGFSWINNMDKPLFYHGEVEAELELRMGCLNAEHLINVVEAARSR